MEKAGEILKKLLDKDSADKARYYNSLFSSWTEIVQEPLAGHSRVIDIEYSQLLIGVDHPGWLQLFQFSERQILKKINSRYPELAIKGIKIRVEANPARPVKSDTEIEKKPAAEIGNQDSDFQPAFEHIKDGELRNIFINLYKTVVDKSEKEGS